MKLTHLTLLQALGLVCTVLVCDARRRCDCPPDKPALVCTEDEDCGGRANCTGGPVTLEIQGQGIDVMFCDRPFKPEVRFYAIELQSGTGTIINVYSLPQCKLFKKFHCVEENNEFFYNTCKFCLFSIQKMDKIACLTVIIPVLEEVFDLY